MSTFLSQARARARRPATGSGPRLTIVPKLAARAPRVPFVLCVVTLLAGGLVGLLLLNTSLQRGAYVAGGLRAQSAALYEHEQALQRRVAALQDPQRVSHRAEALGMVPNDSPAFLVLGSGKVLGRPAAAVASDAFDFGRGRTGAQSRGDKVVPPQAGAVSLATPSTVVPGPGPRRDGTATNTGDTLPGSAGPGAPPGTHDSSGTHHQQTR